MLAFILGLLTGAGFGVVLYKVGASRYSRVIGMLTLRDTKVMKFAFAAIATASLLYGLADLAGVAGAWHLTPRVMPFLGWAHLLGGAVFGVAMGATGFCPGTCIARTGGGAGDKKWAAPAAVAGLFAGILVYVALRVPLTEAGVIATIQKPITLHGLLGLPYGAVAMAWGALFLAISFLVDQFLPEKRYAPSRAPQSPLDVVRGEWSWLAAGAVGGALIVLATAQDGYLGFSGALLALVGWAAHLVGQPLDVVPALDATILWRSALIPGALLGGVAAHAFSIPSEAARVAPLPKTLDLAAIAASFLGGLGLALGAMIGGGCTTGAFIAAWPTLSVGSLAMGGTFFAASMATSNALLLARRIDLGSIQRVGDRVYN